MDFEPLAIDGVFLIRPKRFADERGVFSETYRRQSFVDAGIDADFVQDNFSHSKHAGTVRGLHFQTPPHAQAKLVRCLRGRIRDVVVDLRKGSSTYGEHVAADISGEDGLQVFVPAGFAHGFSTLTDGCDVTYKVDAYYAPDHDAGLRWDDPDLNIDWQLPTGTALTSPKDAALPAWSWFESPFVFQGATNHA